MGHGTPQPIFGPTNHKRVMPANKDRHQCSLSLVVNLEPLIWPQEWVQMCSWNNITEIATTKFELKYDWFCYIHMSYIFRHIASGLIHFLYIMIFVTVPLSESCFYPVDGTNWWFQILPPEILSIVDASYPTDTAAATRLGLCNSLDKDHMYQYGRVYAPEVCVTKSNLHRVHHWVLNKTPTV